MRDKDFADASSELKQIAQELHQKMDLQEDALLQIGKLINEELSIHQSDFAKNKTELKQLRSANCN